MESFIERHGLADLTNLVDDDGSLWERFGVFSQPAWVFVNDDGTATGQVGLLGEDGLREQIDRLATEPGDPGGAGRGR